jgi:DNA (cytosine-5)-methyltransferase 1
VILRREHDWHYPVKQLSSGLVVPASSEVARRPKGVDLFCGCGGFSLGFIQAGFEVVAACDNDEAATITYAVNLGTWPMEFHWLGEGDKERLNTWLERDLKRQSKQTGKGKKVVSASPYQSSVTRIPTSGSGWISSHPEAPGVGHFYFGDIRKLTGERMLKDLGMRKGELDCVFGGQPCQGFSSANRKRNEHDPRNSLVFEFIRLVLELQPKTMALENVPEMLNMVTPEGLPIIDVMCQMLADGNFATYESLRLALAGEKGYRAAISRASGSGKKVRKYAKPKPKKPGTAGVTQASLFDLGSEEGA